MQKVFVLDKLVVDVSDQNLSVTGRHYEIMYLISEKEIENVPRIINFYRGKGNAPSDSPAPTTPRQHFRLIGFHFGSCWVTF
jgi:hypothetical protein